MWFGIRSDSLLDIPDFRSIIEADGNCNSRHQHFLGSNSQSPLWGVASLQFRDTSLVIMARTAKDLTGQTFEMLTIIGRADDPRKSRWTCRCECGQIRDFFLVNLRLGKVVSCGCQKRSKLDDLTGRVFTRLTVIRRSPNGKPGIPRWECRCECGAFTEALAGNLKAGTVKSCGCLRIDNNFKHGHSPEGNYSPEYRAWCGMKTRVNAEHPDKNYAWYKGRGIGMCERWESFPNFLADMGLKPSPKHSLDRINNDLGYFPENCRWASSVQQARNQRKSINLTYEGATRNLKEWCEILGISYTAAYNRYRRGYATEQVLSRYKFTVHGKLTEILL